MDSHVLDFPLSGNFSVWLPLVVMVAFSIATLNVDGIRHDGKRARSFEHLRSLKYDFICFKKLMFRLRILRRGPPNGGPLLLESWWQQIQGCGDSL